MEKVLIVDDEELVTEALERLLHGEDFETLTASSAEKALSILEQEEIAVIISDEHMPGLSGGDFLTLVRKLHPRAIRIILTGYATVETALQAINEGEVFRFFLKPCDFTVLKKVVLEALELRRSADREKQMEDTIRKQSVLLEHLQQRCLELEQLVGETAGPAIGLEEGTFRHSPFKQPL